MIKEKSVELRHQGFYVGLVSSLIVSLAAVAVISRNHPANRFELYAAAFALPIPIALSIRDRSLLPGASACFAALMLFLAVAVIFAY
jgi:hypothetical protein